MMETVEFGMLAEVQVLDAGRGDAMWVLSDATGRKAGFKVNADGLAKVLQVGLQMAGRAHAQPDQAVALPAKDLSVGPGRNPKEVALHIDLGGVKLAYLLPVDSVVISLGTLVSGLYTDPEGSKH